MKKIIFILFLFLLFLSCYIIYTKTKNNSLYITAIGDDLATYNYLKNQDKITYNTKFTDKDLRINDLLNSLINNDVEKKELSLHQTLRKSDVLIISIGMNDLYYKLKDDTREIYTYLNNIVNTYDEILEKIAHYNYQEVIVLGYYNITNENNDIFTYINYKIAKIANERHYTYINLNKILYNKPEYLKKTSNIYLNDLGFKQISSLIVENLKKYDII